MITKNIEDQYHDLLFFIKNHGYEVKNDRTGVGTLKDFGHFMKFTVDEYAFPIITSKFVHFKSIVVELLWMLNGDDNTEYLRKHGVTIWDEWAAEDGSLNGVYGKQWREWPSKYGGSYDQIRNLVHTIKYEPYDRRQLVSAWNVGEVDDMNLPPCHYAWQTNVSGNVLNLMMHQRSCDMFLGVPFNLTSYSLLLCILARLTGKKPGFFNWTGGDCHIYSNHMDQIEKQLDNYYTNSTKGIKFPQLKFDDDIDFTSLESFLETTLDNPERIYLENYNHMGSIKGEVAI